MWDRLDLDTEDKRLPRIAQELFSFTLWASLTLTEVEEMRLACI